MRRPLICQVIALMSGIVTGYFICLPSLPLHAVLSVILLGLLTGLMKKITGPMLPLTAAAIFILGILNINLYLYQSPGPGHIVHQLGKEKLTVEGIITETPQESPEGAVLIIEVLQILKEQAIPVEGKVMLTVLVDPHLQYGDLIRFRSRLRKPRNFNNPGSFDYEKQLRAEGILVRGMVNDGSDIMLIRTGLGNSFKMGLERVRDRLRQVIKDHAVTPEREIIQALLLGETKPIPPLLRENFNRTGTSHILAISGLNVALVASLAIFLTMLAMKSSPYLLLRFNAVRISTLVALLPVLIYSLIAGMGISVIRATIMLLVFLVAILLRKERDLFNTLALAALIILLLSPYALFNVSFQLSFAAVASLIFVSPLLTAFFQSKQAEGTTGPDSLPRKIGHNLLMFIFLSLSATLGTLPIIAYSFNGFSTISLLANAILVPLLGMAALVLGMAVILALPLSAGLAALLVKLTSLPVRLSVTVVNFLASVPGSYVAVITPNMLEIVCYYLLLITLVIIMRNRIGGKVTTTALATWQPIFLKIFLPALAVFFVADTLYLAGREHFRRQLQVTAIDVGQGSATLIRLPAGKNMLVDGGGSATGSFDMGKFVLAPYLWRQRINRIDWMILTHEHPDHLQGLLYILKNFNIGEVWTNDYPATTDDYNNFLQIVKELGISHRVLREKTASLMSNGVGISIFNAGKSSLQHKRKAAQFQETNDSSLVIRIALGKVGFLLPGDISGSVEKRFMESGVEIKSDVLFMPHHGSITSSSMAFLRAVHPRIAIVSCGRDNLFNLPHPDILKRYAGLPARVYRTDLNGAITLTTDGREISVETTIVEK